MSKQKLSPLPNIEELIDGQGQITIGAIEPVSCAAIAVEGRQPLAMLVRRKRETLVDLLTRLDAAIEVALEEGVPIDEINNGPSDQL